MKVLKLLQYHFNLLICELNNFTLSHRIPIEFMNEIIADEKDINNEIFWNYCKYQN